VSSDGVFYSIQGEGVSIGEPAVFLRLHSCNLRCGFCDTKYVWDESDAQWWTLEETVDKIKKAWGCLYQYKKRRLVITGGEPLLQKELLDRLIKKLPLWEIEIETNGAIMPTDLQLKRCQFNCSPKLENSNNPKKLRIKKEVLEVLSQESVNSNFKFVVASKEDAFEVEKDFVRELKIPRDRVIFMPLGISSEELRKNAINVVEYAKKRGFRLVGRLQVDLWGKKRAV
jgi:organic radical activating enzyme